MFTTAIQNIFTRASLINRKFHIQQRSATAIIDANVKLEDVKSKLVADANNANTTTTYIKMAPFSNAGDFIVSNANNVVLDTSSAAAVAAANHNYSLAPNHPQQMQAPQPITLISQSPHNKYIINTQTGQSTSGAIVTPLHQQQDLQPQQQQQQHLQKKQTLTGSNVKVNLVSSLTNAIQHQQPGK